MAYPSPTGYPQPGYPVPGYPVPGYRAPPPGYAPGYAPGYVPPPQPYGAPVYPQPGYCPPPMPLQPGYVAPGYTNPVIITRPPVCVIPPRPMMGVVCYKCGGSGWNAKKGKPCKKCHSRGYKH